MTKTAGSFRFWQRWLLVSSLLFALFGICFALFPDSLLFRAYYREVAQLLWGQAEWPREADAYRYFVAGPFGGTIAAYYLLMAFLAHRPFRQKERWAYMAIAASAGLWVLLDSARCLQTGIYFQVYLINLFSITVKALPLVFTHGHFFGRSRTLPGS